MYQIGVKNMAGFNVTKKQACKTYCFHLKLHDLAYNTKSALEYTSQTDMEKHIMLYNDKQKKKKNFSTGSQHGRNGLRYRWWKRH